MKRSGRAMFAALLVLVSCRTRALSTGEIESGARSEPEASGDRRPDSVRPIPGEVGRALVTPPEAQDLDPAPGIVHLALRADRAPGPELHYTYDGTSPGPTIRAKVGDTLHVSFTNGLDAPTTIHWHGVHAPFAMDGVPWMRDPVMPDETFEYVLPLDRAGTFWYHPHFDTEHQLDAGLYGALVVEDPAEPRADDELILVFDTTNDLRDPHPEPHGLGRMDTRWTVNGELEPRYSARGGTRVRARLVNASNMGYLAITWPNLRQIGSDQGLLPELAEPDRLLLAPGDRADVEWLIGQQGFDLVQEPYSLNGGDALGDPMPVLHVDVTSPAPAPAGLAWPFSAGGVTPDPGYTDIVYVLSGSDRTGEWRINGERFPNITMEEAALGGEVIIELRNLSGSEHPFHTHALSFEVLSVNGVPPAHRTVEDTFNVRIRDAVRLRLVADNPGDWMFHCHILPHAEDGMMTMLRVQ